MSLDLTTCGIQEPMSIDWFERYWFLWFELFKLGQCLYPLLCGSYLLLLKPSFIWWGKKDTPDCWVNHSMDCYCLLQKWPPDCLLALHHFTFTLPTLVYYGLISQCLVEPNKTSWLGKAPDCLALNICFGFKSACNPG